MSTQHSLEITGGLDIWGYAAATLPNGLDPINVQVKIRGAADVPVLRSEIDDLISFLIAERDRCDMHIAEQKCLAEYGDGKLRCALANGHDTGDDWSHIDAEGQVW